MGTLKLTLLGGFQLEDQGDPIAISAKKAKALLAYLSLHLDVFFSRDKLSALLWEDSDNTQARQSLRQTLAVIRKVLPDKCALISQEDKVCLKAGYIDVDVLNFERLGKRSTRRELEQAVNYFKGDLLEGFNPKAATYDDWLMLEQSRLRDLALKLMQKLLPLYVEDGDYEAAIQLNIRILTLDPLREAMHRQLMSLYATQGHFGAALKQYRSCKSTLSRELQVSPDPETAQLYREILAKRNHTTEKRDETDCMPIPEVMSPKENVRDENVFSEDVCNKGGNKGICNERVLRQLVIVVSKLVVTNELPFHNDPEVVLDLQNKFYQEVNTITEKQGGCSFRQMGGTVMTVFGTPVIFCDDINRAFATAKALLQGKLQRTLNIKIKVGIASGRVLVEQTNSKINFIGSSLSQAEQLADLAGHDDLVVSDSVYQVLISQGISAEKMPTSTVMGSEAWRVENFEFNPARNLLIGRNKELRLFFSFLEECEETESGQILLIRGEAGIGKSRLTEEFRWMATEAGFEVHRVYCHHLGQSTENDTIAELVKSLLHLSNENLSESETGIKEAEDQQLVRPKDKLFIKELLNLTLDDDEARLVEEMDAAALEEGLILALKHVLGNCAQLRPQLIVVEDIHWASPQTLMLLTQLANSVTDLPILLMMTTRIEGEPFKPSWRNAMLGVPLTTLDLSHLRERESVVLAEQFTSISAEQRQQCVARAQGNPFFLQQLLYSTAHVNGQVPDSIHGIVWSRMELLQPLDKIALQSAAVLGNTVAPDMLSFLLDNDSYQCDNLVEHRFFQKELGQFSFVHALFRETIYESILSSERKRYHHRAAQYFEDKDLLLFAKHLRLAEDAKAPEAFFLAAESQHRRNLSEQALDLVHQGLELNPVPKTKLRLLKMEGELYRHLGKTESSVASFESALTIADDELDAVSMKVELAASFQVQDRISDALDMLDQAEQIARRKTDDALLARIHYLRGNCLFPLGRFDACLREHQLSLKYARKAGSPLLEARAYSGLGDAYYQRGQMLTAKIHYKNCIDLAEQAGYKSIRSINMAMFALTSFFEDERETAIAVAREALALAMEVGYKRGELIVRDVIINMKLFWNQTDHVAEHIQCAETLAKQLGSTRFYVEIQCFKGFLAYLNGNGEAAESILTKAFQLCDESSISYAGPLILGVWARVTANEEKRKWALKEGEALLEVTDCVSHNYLFFYQSAIEAALERDDFGEAKKYANALAKYTADEPLPASDYFIEVGRREANV